LYFASVSGTLRKTMASPVDRLNELPPLPRRTPTPRRSWRYVLVLVTVVLIADAFFGERGLVALYRANQEHAELQGTIDALRAENGRLQRYAHALTSEPRFLEEVARGELGLIRPGEQLFTVRTTAEPADGATPAPRDDPPDVAEPSAPGSAPAAGASPEASGPSLFQGTSPVLP
jgi:cell division protein FtsB